MKSFLVFCGIVLALLTTPALADSFSINNQGLTFGSATSGGIFADSTVIGLTIAGVTLPLDGSLVLGTGPLTGSLENGATFSSGELWLNLVGGTIFASNFTGWSPTASGLYELAGTFSSIDGIHFSTDQFFLVQFEKGQAFLRDVSGSTTISSVPEPGSLTLLGTGLVGLAGVARRKFSGGGLVLKFLSQGCRAENGTK